MEWPYPSPGYLEIDLVAHGGGGVSGAFIHSLVATDVCSGWTEAVPLLAREQSLVVEPLEADHPEPLVSVPVRGIDSDNDSVFINETLVPRTCEENEHRPFAPGLGRTARTAQRFNQSTRNCSMIPQVRCRPETPNARSTRLWPVGDQRLVRTCTCCSCGAPPVLARTSNQSLASMLTEWPRSGGERLCTERYTKSAFTLRRPSARS